MIWQVKNATLKGDWLVIAQFRYSYDAEDFVIGMVKTRGYSRDVFQIEKVSA